MNRTGPGVTGRGDGGSGGGGSRGDGSGGGGGRGGDGGRGSANGTRFSGDSVLFRNSRMFMKQYVPYNTMIGLSVVALNIFVIHFYIKQYRKFVPTMYLLISICDSVMTLAMFTQSAVLAGWVYEEDQLTTQTAWILLLTTEVMLLVYRLSVFVNMLLSVARTIKITRPFYQIRRRLALASVAVYAVCWVALAGLDVIALVILPDAIDATDLDEYIYQGRIGEELAGILQNFTDSRGRQQFSDDAASILEFLLLLAVPFLMPVLISLVCLLILVHFMRKPSPSEASAVNQRHVTITVIWLTFLFLVCISSCTFYFIIKDFILISVLGIRMGRVADTALFGLFQTTLPLINAAICPIIIISRSTELRGRVGMMWTWCYQRVYEILGTCPFLRRRMSHPADPADHEDSVVTENETEL